jgi:hypothetical protein
VTVDGARKPKVGQLVDLGRPPEDVEVEEGVWQTVYQLIQHSSAMSNGDPAEPDGVRNFCLSVAVGVDLQTVTADTSITNLMGVIDGEDRPWSEFQSWLLLTPTNLGWNTQKRNQVTARIQSIGGNTAGLTMTTPLHEWINRAGKVFRPEYDVRGSFVYVPGA